MEKLIAVYGTLKKGQHNHGCMGDSELLGKCVTPASYTMYHMGGFPAVAPEGNTQITCEIYKVTDENTLDGIFSLEGYTGERGNSRNWYDTTEIDTEFGKAEMFIMNAEKINHSRVVEDGIWG